MRVNSHTHNHPVLNTATLGFSAGIERSGKRFGIVGEDYSTACASGEWQLLMSSPPSDLAPQATSMKNGWRAGGGGVMRKRVAGTEGPVIRIMNPEPSGSRETSGGRRKSKTHQQGVNILHTLSENTVQAFIS